MKTCGWNKVFWWTGSQVIPCVKSACAFSLQTAFSLPKPHDAVFECRKLWTGILRDTLHMIAYGEAFGGFLRD